LLTVARSDGVAPGR